MRAAALLLIAAAAGPCQESNEFGVLSTVAPEAAHLGGIKFRVAFTGTSEYTPAVIILDNGVSPPSDQPCIAEELAAALPGLPSVPVYAPYGGRPDLIYVTNMVNGVQLGLLSEIDLLNYLLSHPGQMDTAIDELVEADYATVTPQTKIKLLKNIFNDAKLVCVLEKDDLVGVISKIDLIEYLAGKRA